MTPHLLHVFATFAAGGPQVRTARLIAGLGASWRHSILAMDGVHAAEALLPADVETRVLDPLPRAGTFPTVRGLRRMLRRERPDLLLTYNWGAIEAVWAGRLAGVPNLHHEDGFLPDELAAFKRRRVLARRLTLRGVRGVVVPSHTLQAIATGIWRLPAASVHCIPNGITVDELTEADGNAALRAKLGIPPEAVVVGSVGHLRPEKNPARLVRAVARMQHRDRVQVLMLGDGPERASVEAAAREGALTERVHLAGHRVETGPYYRAMDVFALSSDTEQMPVALLEAMACGLPAVSTDVGDVARILPAVGRAHVVAKADEAALATALDALVEDADGRRRLGAANRARVRERYSFAGMLEAYRALYRRALG